MRYAEKSAGGAACGKNTALKIAKRTLRRRLRVLPERFPAEAARAPRADVARGLGRRRCDASLRATLCCVLGLGVKCLPMDQRGGVSSRLSGMPCPCLL
jgi:hypothetical protein